MSDIKKRIKNTSFANLIETGKIQPQAIELEEAVLGAILLEKDAYSVVAPILTAESFYKDAHVIIFQSCAHLFSLGSPIDILTVTNHLRSTGQLDLVGGAYNITTLTNRVGSSANIFHHAKIIQQKYILRRVITIGSEAQRDAFDDSADPDEQIAKLETALNSLNNDMSRGQEIREFTEDLKEVVKVAEQANKNHGVTGVPSTFYLENKKSGGYHPTDFTVIAARPGMGKTSYAIQEAKNMSLNETVTDFKKKVLFFSLEMSKLQLTQRIISSSDDIELARLRKGNFDDDGWAKLNKSVSNLWGARLHIDDTPSISVSELRRKSLRMANKFGVAAIWIDYLQLMRGDDSSNRNGNREQEISYVSRSLKALAKELNVPVIALAQLSRASEKRTDSIPLLSDLRESGSIEQDADVVKFLYRPEYYGITEDAEGNSVVGLAKVIYAKHRNGALGDVNLKWEPEYTRFANYEYPYTPDFDEQESSPPPF